MKLRKINLNPSKELSYILGVILGDGNVSLSSLGTGRIRLIVKDNKFINSFNESICKLFKKKKKYSIMLTKKGYFSLTAYSNYFYRWFKSKNEREIIKIASIYPIEFIRGFYESEGGLQIKSFPRKNKQNKLSYFTTEFRVHISNCNKGILQHIKSILSKFDIDSKLNYVFKTKGEKNYYRLTIFKQNHIKRFFKLINPCIKKLTYTIFKIDLDTTLIEDWKEDFLKSRKIILRVMRFRLEEFVCKSSIKCNDCGYSLHLFETEINKIKKCIRCGSKKIIRGRGYHCWFKCFGREIDDMEKVKIQWLLGDDETRSWLCKLRVERGIITWNKLFSKVIYRKPRSKKCLEFGFRNKIIKLTEGEF